MQLSQFKPDLDKIAIYCHVELENINIKLKSTYTLNNPVYQHSKL